jgi:hypothetical protein
MRSRRVAQSARDGRLPFTRTRRRRPPPPYCPPRPARRAKARARRASPARRGRPALREPNRCTAHRAPRDAPCPARAVQLRRERLPVARRDCWAATESRSSLAATHSREGYQPGEYRAGRPLCTPRLPDRHRHDRRPSGAASPSAPSQAHRCLTPPLCALARRVALRCQTPVFARPLEMLVGSGRLTIAVMPYQPPPVATVVARLLKRALLLRKETARVARRGRRREARIGDLAVLRVLG